MMFVLREQLDVDIEAVDLSFGISDTFSSPVPFCNTQGFRLLGSASGNPNNFYRFNWTHIAGDFNSPQIEVYPNSDTIYTLEVVDADGCIGQHSFVFSLEEFEISNINYSDSICYNSDEGFINISALGEGIMYSIDDGENYQSSGIFDQLSSGDYTILIKNDIGCIISESFTISEYPLPPELMSQSLIGTEVCYNESATLVLPQCDGCTYRWREGNNDRTFNTGPLTETTIFEGTVIYGNGCEITFDHTVEVRDSLDLSITGITKVCSGSSTLLTANCKNCEVSWSTGSDDHSIEVESVTEDVTISLTVSDEMCSTSKDITIKAFDLPSIDLALNNIPEEVLFENSKNSDIQHLAMETCPGEQVTISTSISGDPLEYTFDWDHILGNDDPKDIDVSSHIDSMFYISVRDESGCSTRDSFELLIDEILVDSFDQDGPSAMFVFDGMVRVEMETPDEGLMYSIDGGSTYQDSSTFSELDTGNYNVHIMNENGCVIVEAFRVTTESWTEICGNGVDDDGDDLMDEDCFFFRSLEKQADEDYRNETSILQNIVLPSSPEAASLGKYGDFSFSHYTGTANITIPIYSIPAHDLSLDIKLNYGTGGLKVQDEGTWVGMEWTLTAGGVVTRSTRGNPDTDQNYYGKQDLYEMYYDQGASISFKEMDFYEKMSTGEHETIPDIYYYNFNGRSGKFYITPDQKIIQKEGSDLEINPSFVQGGDLTSFIITDEMGTRYIFSKREITQLTYDDNAASARGRHQHLFEFTSSWYLSEIRNYKNTEKIFFSYEVSDIGYFQPILLQNYESRSFNRNGDNTCACEEMDQGTPSVGYPEHLQILNRHYLSQISYHLGLNQVEKLVFKSSENTCTLEETDRQLDNIILYRGPTGSSPIIEYPMSYECVTDRLFLLECGQRPHGSDNYDLKPPYRFDYISGVLPGVRSLEQDIWGFYNAASQNTQNMTLVPLHPSLPKFTLGANRSVNEETAKHGSLNKITYPTGGFTVLDYESNTRKGTVQDITYECRPCVTFETCNDEGSCCSLNPSNNWEGEMTFTDEELETKSIYLRSEFICGDGPNELGVKNDEFFSNCRILEDSQDIPGHSRIKGAFNLEVFKASTSERVICLRYDQPDDLSIFQLDFDQYFSFLEADTSYIFKITSYDLKIQGEFQSKTSTDRIIDEKIGGLRIKTQSHFDFDGTLLQKTRYKYVEEDGISSSGKLMTEPNFLSSGTYTNFTIHRLNGNEGSNDECNKDYSCTTYTLSANSTIPLATTQGSFVGYDRVEEIILANNDDGTTAGKTVYNYHNYEYDNNTESNPIFIDRVKNGQLISMEILDDSDKILKKNEYKYSWDVVENRTQDTLRIYRLGTVADQDNRSFLCKPKASTQLVWREDQPNPSLFEECRIYPSKWDRNSSDYETMINHTVYRSEDKATSYFYDQEGNSDGEVILTTEYKYDNKDHLQITRQKFTNSDGTEFETFNIYGGDISDNAGLKDFLVNSNIKAIPISSSVRANGEEIFRSETEWKFIGANGEPGPFDINKNAYPYQEYHYEYTYDETGKLTGGAKELKGEIIKYDVLTGLPLEYAEKNWEPRSLTRNTRGQITEAEFLDHKQEFTYNDTHHQLTQVKAVDGTLVDITYDDLIRKKTQTDPQRGASQEWDYEFRANTGLYPFIKITESFEKLGDRENFKLENYAYVDGLGRPIQAIKANQGPIEVEDVVVHTGYDKFGRKAYQYEPFAISKNNGAYVSGITPQTHDHTFTELEASPLSRTLSITPPDWYPTRYEYGTNHVESIVDPLNGGNYGQDELFRQRVIDPNGNITDSYSDKKNRAILTRRLDDNEGNPNDTYTAYDHMDRIKTVLPPGTTSDQDDLIFQYLYYPNGQVQQKDLPDSKPTEYIYNDRELLAYMQDGEMKNDNQWYSTQYDDYGRVTTDGFYVGTVSEANEGFDQAMMTDPLNVTTYGTSGISIDKPVKIETHLLTTKDILTAENTYDAAGRIDFTESTSLVNQNLETTPDIIQYMYDSRDNILRSEQILVAYGNSEHLIFTNEYDHAGRLSKEIFRDNLKDEIELTETKYTAKDQIANIIFNPSAPLANCEHDYLDNQFLSSLKDVGPASLFELDIEYDAPTNGATSRLNGDISSLRWKTSGYESQYYNYRYDYLNRLTAADYNNGAYSPYDGYYNTNYTYDQRGNIMTLSRRSPSADFQSSSMMDQLVYTPKAGSNQVASISDGGDVTRGYQLPINKSLATYDYDDNGAMSTDGSRSATFTNNHLNLPDRIKKDDKNYVDYFYDAGGALQRKVVTEDGAITETRDYIGPVEYKNGEASLIHFSHGFLSKTLSETMPMMAMPRDTLPVDTVITAQEIISSAVIMSGANVLYEATDSIVFLPPHQVQLGADFTARIIDNVNNSLVEPEWRPHYNIKDHLGNTRVIFSDEDEDGSLTGDEVSQINHYYPFGMEMKGEWQRGNALDFDYTYNGKEFEDGLGYFNYGARFYDPTIGRWNSVDNLSEKYSNVSPFVYALNTPNNAFDPDGNLVIFVNGFRVEAYGRYLLKKPWSLSRPPWNHSQRFFRHDKYNYWTKGDFSSKLSGSLKDFDQLYVDGMYSAQSSGGERYSRGYEEGKILARKIKSGKLNLNGQTIKIVGHSHGSAHASGLAAALVHSGLPVEYLLLFASHQPNQFSAPCDLICGAYQFSRTGDKVSSRQEALGVLKNMVGDSEFGHIAGAILYSLENGDDDRLGNHSIETYTDPKDLKRDDPDLYRILFGDK